MTGSDRGGNLLKGVVWCRQVDNEAESPRYTPAPGDFPGLAESLPRIRFVGDLAINASDTSDYWDPDPARRLSYYNNLFLFPSQGGKYLCLGRMFLSTEERPRLGSKTLVLDAELLFSGRNAARTLKEWYFAMDALAPKLPPSPRPPALTAALSQALTYDDTETDTPLLLFLSSWWGSTVDTLFDILEHVPETLLSLSGILVFPYFIPAAKVDAAHLARTFPLTLAALRVPSRATLDQRHRWIEGWSKKDLTVVDLTSAPAKPSSSLSSTAKAWVDNDGERPWDLFRELVDAGELKRALSGPFPPEEGEFRRKELARVAEVLDTIMAGDKKKGKGAKRPQPTPPVPDPLPSLSPMVSVGPPWLDTTHHARVDRVGFASPPPLKAPLAPATPEPTPSPPAPLGARTHPGHSPPSLEEVESIVAARVSEEMARYFTGEHGLIADRFTQVDALRIQLKDLDDRLRTFAERTLPVLRKTWAKVGEMKQSSPARGSLYRAKELEEIKQELWQELKRMEKDFTKKSGEILERMESTLQTQGRIWLTLVREVERLSEERHGRLSDRREPRK